MNLLDEVGAGEEALGAPEGVLEVGAVGLQLRRQTAVHHHRAAARAQKLSHHVLVHSFPHQAMSAAREEEEVWSIDEQG